MSQTFLKGAIFGFRAYQLGAFAQHVHLLMPPHLNGGIGKVMQMLRRYYVQYFNFQYNRTGTLWEGRYKATVLDSDNIY